MAEAWRRIGGRGGEGGGGATARDNHLSGCYLPTVTKLLCIVPTHILHVARCKTTHSCPCEGY